MKDIHEIWLGDSIELCKKFNAGKVHCVITDPPFGVDNQSNMATTAHGKSYARKIANDETPEKAIATFQAVMTSLLPAMKPESDIYVFTSYQVLEEWLVMTRAFFAPFGYERKAILIWEKDGPGMGDLDTWGMATEFVLYFKRGRRERTDTRRNNVIHVPQLRPSELIHPHEKPPDLLKLFIKHSTSPGEFLVDPFGGSGSLVRASQQIGRNAVAIELDEHNYELANAKLLGGEGAGFSFG